MIDNPDKLMKPIKTKRLDTNKEDNEGDQWNINKEENQGQDIFDLYALLTESPKNTRNKKAYHSTREF